MSKIKWISQEQIDAENELKELRPNIEEQIEELKTRLERIELKDMKQISYESEDEK